MSKDKIWPWKADYGPTLSTDKRCENCSMWVKRGNPVIGTCTLVRGLIWFDGVCKFWEKENGTTQ